MIVLLLGALLLGCAAAAEVATSRGASSSLDSFDCSGMTNNNNNNNNNVLLRSRCLDIKRRRPYSMPTMIMTYPTPVPRRPTYKVVTTKAPATTPQCSVMSYSTTISATFDTLVLLGFAEHQVTWDVAFASRRTKLDFLALRYANVAEQARLNATLAGISSIQTNVSIPDDTKLIIPDVISSFGASCVITTTAHVTIPHSIKTFCIGSVCRPVLCPLASDSLELLSKAPSNNAVLFGSSITCEIVEPPGWKSFVDTKIGNSSSFSYEDWYGVDLDGDGVVNILEYYGISLSSLYVDIAPITRRGNRTTINSTNPLDPDTDKDLFTDGYELLYGMDPLSPNDVKADSDGDGLTDFQEQVFHTNPFKADSDGDGQNDAKEILDGTDPLDDSSFVASSRRLLQGRAARITLTVGDFSGSHSERYTMVVGSIIEHAADKFGVVSSATYSIPPGVYPVTVKHRDSNLPTPDFDYQAEINWDSTSEFKISVADPDGLLGFHTESDFDFALGKTATLTIENPKGNCMYATCADCNSDANCEWDQSSFVCNEYSVFKNFQKDKPEDCACEKCKAWADVELKNLEWIKSLPRCPCRAKIVWVEYTVILEDGTDVKYSLNHLRPLYDNGAVWDDDPNCQPFVSCGLHKGAYGCVRSRTNQSKHGQQCCYDRNMLYIPQGSVAAGSPDFDQAYFSHYVYLKHYYSDVRTFSFCCVDCKSSEVCEKYIGSKNGTAGARSDTRGCL